MRILTGYSIKGTTYHTVDYYPYSSLGCMESCGPVWIYPLGLRASQETTAKRKTDDARDGDEDEEVKDLRAQYVL